MSSVILPGSAIGVLGGGQLGRMFAIAARRMGYRVHVLCPDDDTPAGQVADVEVNAPYDDLDAVTNLSQNVDVVTFEFENIPFEAAECAARFVPVRPAGEVLQMAQHRIREKTALRKAGFPTAEFRVVGSPTECRQAAVELGLPCVLKTASWGYDGKGQSVVRDLDDVESAWTTVGDREAILERFVDFESELSVVGVRNEQGDFASYGPFLNIHANHILDISMSPAGRPPDCERNAVDLARAVLDHFNVVGVLCVELFLTHDEQILINELAPRPHNSGHLTVDAHQTCQFEQQVRTVCGLPLGSTRQLRPAAMANLLGDLWSNGSPRWDLALHDPDIKLHLYGKHAPRPGRKMGHLTALADSAEEAAAIVQSCRVAVAS